MRAKEQSPGGQTVSGQPQAASSAQQPAAPAPAIQRTRDPQSLTPAHVLQLQGTVGNRAVGRLMNNAPAPAGGLPAPLKSGMEDLSGMALDDVRVHYNSAKPAQVQASAYAQGTEIHVAPGQERHLPHEAWHVVQQAQGRVRPTLQLKDGVQVNDDKELEREADVMGERAVQRQAALSAGSGGGDVRLASALPAQGSLQRQVMQRFESGEHAMIGAGPSTSLYPDGEGDLTLPQGAVVFTGELVAFGDFYADMQQMLEAPRQELEALAGLCRLEAIWFKARRLAAERAQSSVGGQVAPNAPGAKAAEGPASASTPGGGPGPIVLPGAKPEAGPEADAAHLKNQPDEVPKEIWETGTLANGKTLLQVRTAIFNQFYPVWALFGISLDPAVKPDTGMGMVKATLGRRRFRSGGSGNPAWETNQGENDSLANPKDTPATRPNKSKDPSRMGGDYLDLAMNNLSHFTTDNWDSWAAMHIEACKDAKGTDLLKAKLAKAKDMLGSHFLTDRFSTGHFVDKGELMTYATKMMVTQAEANLPKHKKTVSADTLLTEELKAAVKVCFEDGNVALQWTKGVEEAQKNGVLGQREAGLLTSLPSSIIADKLVDVIMSMPWRHFDPAQSNNTSAEGRSYGPPSVGKSAAQPSGGVDANGISSPGDYHLGVGNLAALQVHDALNAIGFTVTNGRGQQWRAQGDDHMSATTQDIAHACVMESQSQVDSGTPDLPAVAKYLPTQAYIDPSWISDYFLNQLGTSVFDAKALEDLRSYVNGRTIPINYQGGHNNVSAEMTSVCHQIMNILFIQPKGATALQDDGKTGLNISRLKAFLIARLHEMVGFAYLSTSAADLPAAALELYAPRDPVTRAVLPRSANDFVWTDDNQVTFNLDVTGCAPGRYWLTAHHWTKGDDYDLDPRGQKYGRGNADQDGGWATGSARAIGGATNTAGMYGIGETEFDHFLTTSRFMVDVPAGGGDPRGRTVIPVKVTAPRLEDENKKIHPSQGLRYVVIAGDLAGLCTIGRSNISADGSQVGNPTPLHGPLPVATGQGAAKTAPTPPKVKGVFKNAFNWTNNTVLFSLLLDKPAEADGTVTVWIREMDWDIIGSDAQNGTPRAVTVNVFKGMDTSQTVVHTPLVDNWNDTYVQVFRDKGCTDKIAESRTQGHDRGTISNLMGRNPAKEVSDMVWVGSTLRFKVSPPKSDPVYVRFFDKDWGFDYDPSGKKKGRAVNADDPIGGIHTVQVNNGIASVIGNSDSDTYAIVYQDPACQSPLKRSEVHG